MESVSTYIFYFFTFLSLYVQVFFLVTFLENKKSIFKKHAFKNVTLSNYPSITILVPSYNEEISIIKTVESLLKLDYPKEKLQIFVIDDGSKDNTWSVVQIYKDNPTVKLFHQKNGGKYTALNLGLEYCQTEFFSCLDADSTVEPQALQKMMPYFNDPQTMAVIPSALVTLPTTLVQRAQKAEYNMAVFFKKVFSLIGGLHVTPGTLPIYRKQVTDLIGGFRHGHNGEDMEMAFRMQNNYLKIVQCHEAIVHTIPPATIAILYKQRVRWITAYLKNILDYKHMLFSKKYGNFGLFTLPSGVISVITMLCLFSFSIYHIYNFITQKATQINAIGISRYFNQFQFNSFNFDWFFFYINGITITVILCYILLVISMIIGNKMAEGKARFSMNLLYYIGIYSIVAPFWLIKATYNTLLSKNASWR